MSRQVFTAAILLVLAAMPVAARTPTSAPSSAPVSSAATQPAATPDRILFLLAEGFNRGEFEFPYVAFQAAGYDVDIAGPQVGRIAVNNKGPNPHDAEANLSLDQVQPDRYFALVVPGGYSPGHLEKFPRSIEICKAFLQANKPIAAICHGPRLLLRTGLMGQRAFTCLYSVSDELADLWKARSYGAYTDQAVVRDGNLLTSRYPGDVVPFARAALQKFAPVSGLSLPPKGLRIVMLADGLDANDRWTVRELPKAFGLQGVLVHGQGDWKKFLADPKMSGAKVDVLAIMAGGGAAKLSQTPGLAKWIAARQAAGTVVVVDAPSAAALKMQGAFPPATKRINTAVLSQMVAAARKARPTPTTAPVGEPTGPDPKVVAYLQVEAGFDEAIFETLRAWLQSRGRTVVVTAAKAGVVKGRRGLPVDVVAQPAESDKTLMDHQWLSFSPTDKLTVHYWVKGRKGDVSAEAMILNLLPRAFDRPIGPPEDATAVIALRQGFDERAFWAAVGLLVNSGRQIAYIAHDDKPVFSMNGRLKLRATGTYGQTKSLRPGTIIVCPGGVYPEKNPGARQAEQPKWIDAQADRDSARLQWLLARNKAGAMLWTIGMDSLRIGRDPAMKGLRFSTSDQLVWSFGKKGGRYSSALASWADKNIITCSGSETVGLAGRLLREKSLLKPPAKPRTTPASRPAS